MTTVEAVAERVPLARIGDALAGLWERCRTEQPDGALSRALTLNLIGVTRAATADRLYEDLERLRDRHPCRAFLAIIGDDEEETTAQVSGESRSFGRGQEIVLERVELRGGWPQFVNLAALIRPLLVNDIPTHLYWATGVPPDGECFRLVAKMADQTVVDSDLLADPAAEIASLRALMRSGKGLTDLSWLRGRPWRRAVAEAFEHFTWQPGVATSVAIEHGTHPGARVASRLLAEWLRERLGATAEFVEERVDEPVCSAEQLELRHGDVHVLVKRCPEGRLRVEISLADRCLLPFQVPASRGTPGDLLAAAVDLA